MVAYSSVLIAYDAALHSAETPRVAATLSGRGAASQMQRTRSILLKTGNFETILTTACHSKHVLKAKYNGRSTIPMSEAVKKCSVIANGWDKCAIDRRD
jgi:hypothetical protein